MINVQSEVSPTGYQISIRWSASKPKTFPPKSEKRTLIKFTPTDPCDELRAPSPTMMTMTMMMANQSDDGDQKPLTTPPLNPKPSSLHVYSRRPKNSWNFPKSLSFFDSLLSMGTGSISDAAAAAGDDSKVKVAKLAVINDIVEMSVDDDHHSKNRSLFGLHKPRLCDETSQRKKQNSSRSKRWVR